MLTGDLLLWNPERFLPHLHLAAHPARACRLRHRWSSTGVSVNVSWFAGLCLCVSLCLLLFGDFGISGAWQEKVVCVCRSVCPRKEFCMFVGTSVQGKSFVCLSVCLSKERVLYVCGYVCPRKEFCVFVSLSVQEFGVFVSPSVQGKSLVCLSVHASKERVWCVHSTNWW